MTDCGIIIRPVEEHEIRMFTRYFERENFYFATKRPDTINTGMRYELIRGSFIFFDTCEPVGLGKITDKIDGLLTKVELAFFDEAYYSNNKGEVIARAFLDNCVEIYNCSGVIYLMVFEFDALLLSFCEKLGLRKCGVLRSAVYKFGKYHDLEVFSY
ncbi:hypothetical protein SY88_22585 [Clostridiales bacterium PH28_bin88]|nr:hypothetical protein SY88_22585 [Clostridiales bacterium PH28_bin88]